MTANTIGYIAAAAVVVLFIGGGTLAGIVAGWGWRSLLPRAVAVLTKDATEGTTGCQ